MKQEGNKMLEHYYAVIMAGGGGTRLWPLSRKAQPKQMLSLFDERSLFQASVERLEGIFSCERILVVTVEDQAQELQEHSPDIPAENFILEPMPRGTASVVGLAAVALRARDPEAVMAVLTADHYIGDEQKFRHALRSAYDVAQDNYLVTLGIQPTFPATGYGYIQRGEPIGVYGDLDVYHVLRFKEKPDEEQARQMLATGDHAWNSGMFVWKVNHILAEFERQMPELHAGLEEISRAWSSPAQKAVIEEVWPRLKSETIDYGVMEGAERVAVIPAADWKWSDVGSWESLFEVLPTDAQGNIIMGGKHIGLDTAHSLVYVTEERRLIVTIGVSDLVLVDTGDVLLVCHKDQAQRVRQVVDKLKKTDQDYL
jgi:mannose-1-phosphate guanylyltransferase